MDSDWGVGASMLDMREGWGASALEAWEIWECRLWVGGSADLLAWAKMAARRASCVMSCRLPVTVSAHHVKGILALQWKGQLDADHSWSSWNIGCV